MKIRHYLRYPIDIVRAKSRLADRTVDGSSFNSRPIVLDLYTADLLIDCGRHFAAIAHYAAKNHSQVVIRCRRLLLAAIAHKPFGGQMLAMENVCWIHDDEALPDEAIALIDVSTDLADRSRSSFPAVELLIGKDIATDCPVMPYPMHPGVLEHADRESIDAARATQNRDGIFFAGSQREKYGRDLIRRGFGVLNRLEILQFLRETFPDRIVTSLGERHAKMPIILPPTEPGDKAVPISVDQWLPTLAQHQFFLCCPGIAQPMCHNIVEAMSVGVIPIIEYPHRFSPMLTDGVNAIVYQGQGGLGDAIERIDELHRDEIEQLSRNVMNYYDAHLDSEQFVGKLLSESASDQSRQICLPFHDENLTAMKTHLSQRPLAA